MDNTFCLDFLGLNGMSCGVGSTRALPPRFLAARPGTPRPEHRSSSTIVRAGEARASPHILTPLASKSPPLRVTSNAVQRGSLSGVRFGAQKSATTSDVLGIRRSRRLLVFLRRPSTSRCRSCGWRAGCCLGLLVRPADKRAMEVAARSGAAGAKPAAQLLPRPSPAAVKQGESPLHVEAHFQRASWG